MKDAPHKQRLIPEAAGAQTTAQAQTAAHKKIHPVIKNTPDLPPIDWSLIGQQAPALLHTPADDLPQADVVIITWAGAEWAAMQHVFCSGDAGMPYDAGQTSRWPDWQEYNKDLPPYHGQPGNEWTYWGYYRLVEIRGQKVLLFKSNTHLTWPGKQYVEDLIRRLVGCAKPKFLMSVGTAGGARTHDKEGTVNVVRAGTLYAAGEPQSEWPTYANEWRADWSIIGGENFGRLLFPIPTVESDLESLREQFNHTYGTDYSLAQLNVGGVAYGDAVPRINDLTPAGTPLLTTSTFVVATTSGNYADFACVEMDDAVIARICSEKNVAFGFVRNVSDPVQNAELPSDVQGNWGGVLYDAYGLYTSYNGALAAWALVNGQTEADGRREADGQREADEWPNSPHAGSSEVF
jgi:hypothetical protein